MANAVTPVPAVLTVGVETVPPLIVWVTVSVFVSVVTVSATGFPSTSAGLDVVVVLVYVPVNVTPYEGFAEIIQHELSHIICMLFA